MAEVGILIKTKEDGSLEVKKLGGEFDKAGKHGKKSADKTVKGWDRVKAKSSSWIKSTVKLAKSWVGVTAAVVAVTLAFNATVGAAAKLEKGMANVSTLVDTTKVNMDALREGILDMSVEVTKSTDDLTEGLYQVISAGIDTADSLDVLRVSAMAATAGLSDTLTSVDAITTVLNAYGLEAQKATWVSDLMFQTVKMGKTTFSELAGSIGTVIAPAAAVGVKLEDLFATIATLTKGGFDTATATTAMRATLMSILKPGADAIKTAKALNLEWSVSAIRTKGLVGFLNDMKEATGGDTEAMAKLIPEARALNAVLALTGEQSGELNKALEGMEDVLGATKEAFDKQEQTYESHKQKLGLLVDTMLMRIGNDFLPAINSLLEGTLNTFDTVEQGLDSLEKSLGQNISMWKLLFPRMLMTELAAKRIMAIYKDTGEATDGLTEYTRKLHKEWSRMDWERVTKQMAGAFTSAESILRKAVEQSRDLTAETEKTVGAADDLGQAYKRFANTAVESASKAKAAWTGITDEIRDAQELLGIKTKAGFLEESQEAIAAFKTLAQTGWLSDGDFDKAQAALKTKLEEIASAYGETQFTLGFGDETARTEIVSRYDETLGAVVLKTTEAKEKLAQIAIGDTLFISDGQKESILGRYKEMGDTMVVTITRTAQTLQERITSAIAESTQYQFEAISDTMDFVDEYGSFYAQTEDLVTQHVRVAFDTREKYLASYVNTAKTQLDSLEAHIRRIGELGLPQSALPPVATAELAVEDSFARGIDRVPRDMIARLHKDEQVVRADQNPYNPAASGQGNQQSIVIEEGAIQINNPSPDMDVGALADNLIEEIIRRADRTIRF